MEGILIRRLKLHWVFSFLLVTQLSYSQVTKIKLEKKTHLFSFKPDTNIAYRWQKENIVNITSTPDTGISFTVRGVNMEVEYLGDGDYKMIPFHTDTMKFDAGKLLIYKLNAEGEKQIHTAKEYLFIDPVLPKIKIHNVSEDSIIQKSDVANAKLEAFHEGNQVLVLSYSVKREVNDTTVVNDEYLGCEFPIELKNRFRKLSNASVIYFYDVRVKLMNGYIETVPRVTFFVEDNYHPFIEKTN